MAQQTFSGVPGDFTAGQVLTAADMDKLREFLLYLIKDGDEGDTGEVSPLILDLGNDDVRLGGQTAVYNIRGSSDGNTFLNAASGQATYFRINDTSEAVLNVTGLSIGMGNTAATYPLHVQSDNNVRTATFQNTDAAVGSANWILSLKFSADADVTNGIFLAFEDSDGAIGSVSGATHETVSFNSSSDYRLKSDVVDLADAVDTVGQLRPIYFRFTRDPAETVLGGFLAHEVAEVVDGVVVGEKDAMRPPVDAVLDDDGNELEPAKPETIAPQMMDATKLVPLLTAAIQELTARVAALEAAA